MPFKPGDPKPANSGRKLGVKNKKTLLRVADFCAANSFNPLAELVKTLPDLPAANRAVVLLEILKYLAPQIKPVEVQLDVSETPPETVLDAETTERLIAAVKDQ